MLFRSAKTLGELYTLAVNDPITQTPAPSAVTAPSPQPQLAAAVSASLNARDLLSPFDPSPPEAIPGEITTDDNTAPVYRDRRAAEWMGRGTAASETYTLPHSPMVLSPGIVEILATLSPATTRRAA